MKNSKIIGHQWNRFEWNRRNHTNTCTMILINIDNDMQISHRKVPHLTGLIINTLEKPVDILMLILNSFTGYLTWRRKDHEWITRVSFARRIMIARRWQEWPKITVINLKLILRRVPIAFSFFCSRVPRNCRRCFNSKNSQKKQR